MSFTKGCYTGQELVARLDARGARVPWRLVRASGPSGRRSTTCCAPAAPTAPRASPPPCPGDDGVRALGVAHRTLADGEVDGVLVETL